MKPYPWFVALCFSVSSGVSPALAALCAPQSLVHIRTVNVTPGIPAGSFATQPKNFYRLGSDKVRIEEGLDAANGIHGLVVTAEPDIWMVNLYDSTGRHIVDPGPTYNAHVPIFGFLTSNLRDLELGCEADFIANAAAKADRTEDVDGATYDVYRLVADTDAVEILEKPGSNVPSFARLYQKGKLLMILRYELYQKGLIADPTLFERPANIKYVEAG